VIAGIVLAAILVPQGMAYAELAGLPAVTGLYTTIACLVAYAVFGPSKVLVLGPDSSVSPLILATITPLLVTGDTASAIALAGMLAVLVGLIEIGLGVARLGFVADLLSSEVRVGYLVGLSVTIVVGQLPKLFGFSTDADGFIGELQAFVDGLGDTNTTTLITGLGVLAVLLVLPRVLPKVPAVLVAVVGVTVASAALDLASRGVATVGVLPRGVPAPAFPSVSLSDVVPLLVGAVGITMVSLADTIATSASFAARRGEEVHPDQELVGIGASNVAAGLFQGFAVSVSGSRTAVADRSGAKSQAAGLVGAALVALLLLFLNGLLATLPQTALAAVVIVAALSLADLGELRRYAEVRPSSLLIALVAAGGEQAKVTRAAAWLKRQANADGGFGAFPDTASDVDNTAAVIQALAAAGSLEGRPANPAFAFIRRSTAADGGVRTAPPAGLAPNSQSTAWAAQAMIAAGRSASRQIAWLKARTGPSGRVAYAQGSFQTPVWVTSQALVALSGRTLPLAAPPPPGSSAGGDAAGPSGGVAGAVGTGGPASADADRRDAKLRRALQRARRIERGRRVAVSTAVTAGAVVGAFVRAFGGGVR